MERDEWSKLKEDETDEAATKHYKRKRCEDDSDEIDKWKVYKDDRGKLSYAFKLSGPRIKTRRMVAFDLDGTIIKTKSGKSFAVDENDWTFFAPDVPSKLKHLHESGSYLAIISNQKGVSAGHQNLEELQNKIDRIISAIGVPMDVFCSLQSDAFRKPCTASWKFLMERRGPLNRGGAQVSKTALSSEDIYVGDAAGRPKQGHRKKDHSASDLKFARNLGVQVNYV